MTRFGINCCIEPRLLFVTARDFHAGTAVMLVQAFDTPESSSGDFEAFKNAMGAREVAPLICKVDSFSGPALLLAWCDGDLRFRDVTLPSAPPIHG